MSFALNTVLERATGGSAFEAPVVPSDSQQPPYPLGHKGIDVANGILSIVGASLRFGPERNIPTIRRVLVGAEMRGSRGGINVYEPVRPTVFGEDQLGRVGNALAEFNQAFFHMLGIEPHVSTRETRWPDSRSSFRHPLSSKIPKGLQLVWHRPNVIASHDELYPLEKEFLGPEMFGYDFRCLALSPCAVEDISGNLIMPIETRIPVDNS